MAVQGYVFPSFQAAMASKQVNLAADTFQALLIGSASPPVAARTVTETWTHVSDFLANAGAPLTEVSTAGTGYTRQTLTGVTLTTAGLVTTLTCADITWANSTISATYACFYDNTVGGTDATNQLLAYWDFGGTISTSAQPFSLNMSASGLAYWSAAQ